MKIYVDADAMPSIDIIEDTARQYQIPCVLISDDSHQLTSSYSTIITVSKGYQSVDMWLINHLQKGDIVITQDYGVAVLALTKLAKVMNPKGMIYTNDNIDTLLEQRHQNQKLIRQKKYGKGPKKRTIQDDEQLKKSLIHCIEE